VGVLLLYFLLLHSLAQRVPPDFGELSRAVSSPAESALNADPAARGKRRPNLAWDEWDEMGRFCGFMLVYDN
jgi:hypothetical protein